MTILGAATLARGLMMVVELADQPQKAQKKNRPGAGTPNRSRSLERL